MKFADTSWWVAWVLRSDARHADATAMRVAIGATEQVLTTNLVVGETWTFLRKKDSHQVAVEFLDRVAKLETARKLTIQSVEPTHESRAWQWLRRHDDRVYSFVDASSFEVMRERRLREALAFDQDFAAAGFIEVRP